MKLLYPDFLYALGFLVIPILIHLFNFRKYKVLHFSQVRFLQEIQKQTQSTSKLRHLLVLLSRLLMLTALVIAFAQPYIPNEKSTLQQGRKGVSIYIDNSFSMQSKIEDGRLFDLAKNKALSILDAYSASDKFQLLTNDFEGKHQRWLNKSAFIEALQEIEISPTFRDIKAVRQRQTNSYEDNQLVARQYIISDLQKVSFNIDEVKDDSLPLTILPVQSKEIQNVGLMSIDFSTPYRLKGQREVITFSIENFNHKKVDGLSVQLKLDDQLKAPLSINIPEKDTISREIQYKSYSDAWQKATLAIQDYPINFDDSLYFSYPISQSIKMLHLYEDTLNNNIQRLFENDSFIDYQHQKINNLDFRSIGQHSFIILDEFKNINSALQNELAHYTKEGATLLIIPNSKSEQNSYNEFFNKVGVDNIGNYQNEEVTLSGLNTQAQLYQDVFKEQIENIKLPTVKGYWQIQEVSKSTKHKLVGLANGRSFLNEYKVDKGKVFIMATGLKSYESNFSRHAIFVPTLYNMALQSQIHQPSYYIIGEEDIILSNIKKSESPIRIVGNGIDFIPAQKYIKNQLHLQLNNEIKLAGHYELMQKDEFVGLISLNYNRLESNLDSYSTKDIENIAKRSGINLRVIEDSNEQLSNQISYLEQGTPLWKYFIIFALIFLAIEVILLRILK